MERNTIAEMKAIIEAIERGKHIQFTYDGMNWNDTDRFDKPYAPDFMHNRYRIKPEKKWRPFKDRWEFMLTACCNVNWIKSKNSGRMYLVIAIDNDGVVVANNPFVKWESLFKNYTTINDTPCGVEEDV